MSINLVQNKEQETNHLRGKSRFYIAGWVANRECENPQELPKNVRVIKPLKNGIKNTLQATAILLQMVNV